MFNQLKTNKMKKVFVLFVTVLIINFSYAQESSGIAVSVGGNFDTGYTSISAGYVAPSGLTLTAGVFEVDKSSRSILTKTVRSGGRLSVGYSSVNENGLFISSDFYFSDKFHHGMSIGYKMGFFAPSISIDTFSGLGLGFTVILK